MSTSLKLLSNKKHWSDKSSKSTFLRTHLVHPGRLKKTSLYSLPNVSAIAARSDRFKKRPYFFRSTRYFGNNTYDLPLLSAHLITRRALAQKFRLKITTVTRTRVLSRIRQFRISRYRYAQKSPRSRRHSAVTRRHQLFRRKRIALRLCRAPRAHRSNTGFRYKKTQRTRISRRSRQWVSRQKAAKKLNQLQTKRLSKKLRRRSGRLKFRKWERRKNYVAARTFTVRAMRAKASRIFNKTLVKQARRGFSHVLFRRVGTGITAEYTQVPRLRFSLNTNKYFRHLALTTRQHAVSRGFADRQFRRIFRNMNPHQRKALIAGRRRTPRGFLCRYVREHQHRRLSLSFRLCWRRWPFFVRRERTFYPPNKFHKKSLCFRRRVARKSKLFTRSSARQPLTTTLRKPPMYAVLKSLTLVRRFYSRFAHTRTARNASLKQKAFTRKYTPAPHALVRTLAAAQPQLFRDVNLRANPWSASVSAPVVDNKYLSQTSAGATTSTYPRYLVSTTAPAFRSIFWRRQTHMVAALCSRASRAQHLTTIYGRARTAAKRSPLAVTRRTRIQLLTKRRMWRKVLCKQFSRRTYGQRLLVLRIRRRKLARCFRAGTLRRRFVKTMLKPKQKRNKKPVKGLRPFRESRALQKKATKYRHFRNYYVSPRSAKRVCFRALRRVARKLRRKVSRRFGRRSKRGRYRRSHTNLPLARQHRFLQKLLHFKFKRAPHLAPQLTKCVNKDKQLLAKLDSNQRSCLWVRLQSGKFRRRKVFDRYKSFVGSRSLVGARQYILRRKNTWTLGSGARHSKRCAHPMLPIVGASQMLASCNRVPLRLQLFAAQLTATESLGHPFSAASHLNTIKLTKK